MTLRYKTPVYLRGVSGGSMWVLAGICETGQDSPAELIKIKPYSPNDFDQLAVEFRSVANRGADTGDITHDDKLEIYIAGTELRLRHSDSNMNQLGWGCSGNWVAPGETNAYKAMELKIRLTNGDTSSATVQLGEGVGIGSSSGGGGSSSTTKYLSLCLVAGSSCGTALRFYGGSAQPTKTEYTEWFITETPNECGMKGDTCSGSSDCCSYDEYDLRCVGGSCKECLDPGAPCSGNNDECCNNFCLSDTFGVKTCALCLDEGRGCSVNGNGDCCKIDGETPLSCATYGEGLGTCQPCVEPGGYCASVATNCCEGQCVDNACTECEGAPCSSVTNPSGCPCYEKGDPCMTSGDCSTGYCREGTGGNFCDDPDRVRQRLDFWWILIIVAVALVAVLGIALFIKYTWNKKQTEKAIASYKKKKEEISKAGAPASTAEPPAKKQKK